MIILAPKTGAIAYRKAAEAFRDLYAAVTGITLPITETPNDTGDMVVIGTDAVQPYAFDRLPGGFPLTIGSDEYCIISQNEENRRVLYLAGGRGRSTLYAVYDFFERQAGCHYFWDGDVIPHRDTIDIQNLHIIEKPIFQKKNNQVIRDDMGDFKAKLEAEGRTIVNGYTFGPGLVIDGVPQTGYVDNDNAALKSAQRMCLAQVGPLEYLCIVSEGPEDPGSVGLNLEQFTELVASFEGVQNAYNLDGGSSSTMVFKSETHNFDKINSPNNPKRRPLYDIIYFASAYKSD